MKAKLLSNIVGLCILLGGINAIANEPPGKSAGEKKPTGRSMVFRGKIAVVDKSAKTIKVGTRMFQVIDTTKIMKAGKPATIEDAAVGEEVGGAYRNGEGGRLEIVSLRLGAKPGKDDAAKEEKEEQEKDSTE